jgi:hypothetical protein
MRVSTVDELLSFLQTHSIPGTHQVWGLGGDVFFAPVAARDAFVKFPGMQNDTEEMARKMSAIAVSDFDCPV